MGWGICLIGLWLGLWLFGKFENMITRFNKKKTIQADNKTTFNIFQNSRTMKWDDLKWLVYTMDGMPVKYANKVLDEIKAIRDQAGITI